MWKPSSWTFFLGFNTSEADNHAFPTVKHKPHDINNNTAQNPELCDSNKQTLVGKYVLTITWANPENDIW